jgi:hypothetical protein
MLAIEELAEREGLRHFAKAGTETGISTAVQADIDERAKADDVQASLSLKADADDVEESLGLKANDSEVVKHSLATAVGDFLVGAGTSTFTFVKKTLAEVKIILGLGSAAYTSSGDYAVAGKGVTNGDSHDHMDGDGSTLVVANIPVMTSAEFATKISNETGTDKVVFNTSPALITPTINGVKYLSAVKSGNAVVDTWYDAIEFTRGSTDHTSSSGRLTVTVHCYDTGGYMQTGMRVYRIINTYQGIGIVEDGTEFLYNQWGGAGADPHAEAQVSELKIQLRITVTGGTAYSDIKIGYIYEHLTINNTLGIANLL